MITREESEAKLRSVAAKAFSLLEERTGLKLSGLPPKEIKRQVKAWERAQKKLKQEREITQLKG